MCTNRLDSDLDVDDGNVNAYLTYVATTCSSGLWRTHDFVNSPGVLPAISLTSSSNPCSRSWALRLVCLCRRRRRSLLHSALIYPHRRCFWRITATISLLSDLRVLPVLYVSISCYPRSPTGFF
jgi:hypothetical protein